MSHDAHGGHTVNPEAEVNEPPPIPLAPPRNYLWPLGLSLVVAALLIYFLFFFPNGNLTDLPAPPGGQTGMTTVTATAEPSAVALSSPSPTAPPTAAPLPSALPTTSGVSATGTPPAASPTSAAASPTVTSSVAPTAAPLVAPPISLQLGGASFAVEQALQVEPDWKFNPDPTKASWLPNTAVPYIIGIPYSEANAALFAAAKPDQLITIKNSVKSTLRFKVGTVKRVSPDSIATLQNQQTIGLNLYLLADPAPTRAMISASLLDVSGGPTGP
ncbi:MAG: hypothetical protein DLM69_09390 [Candidatus Chloroheliales bacterium]|nr:MAG: hypothetical protein DLM69_09390 [Chloroflexota bacterium]